METKKDIIERHIAEIERELQSNDFTSKKKRLNEVIASWNGKIEGVEKCQLNFYDERSMNLDKINLSLKAIKTKLEIYFDEINT
ncbi:MAG: hypothetical protein GX677_05205 [Treponema sp.]|jgi:hypothetical protein|nr:hypothetical protein [Treponema sp.]